jgi:hypothetical protein
LTEDSTASAEEPVESEDEPLEEKHGDPSVTELFEQLGREVGLLVFCEAQLETARNMPHVRRAGRDAGAVALALLAFATAFVCLNVAAGIGLSTALAGWLAALVLAGVWLVLGGLVGLLILARLRQARIWTVISARPAEAITQLEEARNEAAGAVRATAEQLGPALSIEIASAAVPAAGDIAEGVLDASDDVVEAIAETLPAGSVVNQIWDVALMPGRFGLRVATTVLRRDTPDGAD